MCSVGEVQEVDSRLTCYNLSCCYARKRWRVLFLCLICYVYIHRSLMSTGQESREQLFWWGSFLVAYIHSPNHHRERHDLHLQVRVCFCDQVAYKHSANQKLWCPHCPPPHHHYPDIWHLIKNNSNINSQMHLSFLHCLYFYLYNLYHMINTCIIRI